MPESLMQINLYDTMTMKKSGKLFPIIIQDFTENWIELFKAKKEFSGDSTMCYIA